MKRMTALAAVVMVTLLFTAGHARDDRRAARIAKRISGQAGWTTSQYDFVAPQQSSGSYSFTDLFHSGSTYTEAWGINNSGQVVGYYSDGNNDHGFIYSVSKGSFSPLDHPGATDTEVYGISNNGLVLGHWADSSGAEYEFVRSSDGKFTNIDTPAIPYAIDNDGKVVGTFNNQGSTHGFICSSSGGYSQVDYPSASGTELWGINDSGDVVGCYWTGQLMNFRGFKLSGSNFTPIDYQGAGTTGANGISSNGLVVGSYSDAAGNHVFLWSKGSFTVLDYPGAKYTWANGVNESGEIVGGGATPRVSTSTAFWPLLAAIPFRGRSRTERAHRSNR